MSDYEEDFEDADDVVVEENELTSPSRFVPVQVQSTTRTGLSGGGADGKGATGVSTTQGRKMSKNGTSSQRKTTSLGSKAHLTPRRKAANSTFSKSPAGGFSPRDRVISSKMHAIRSLQNELADARRELVELRKENKLLNRIQVRQEKDLAKLDSQEGELPQLLKQHNEEVRVLKSKLKKSREAAEGHREHYDMLVLEVHQLKDRNKKLEGMSKKKNLLERERLTAELSDVKRALEERERRIVELQHSSELLSKNHFREVKLLQSKNASLQHSLATLEEEYTRLRKQLREKEKEIEVKNIYTQRMPKTMPRLLPKLPTTCDVATMTEAALPAANRDRTPKSKMLTPSPSVPKRKVHKTSPTHPAPTHPAPVDDIAPQSNVQLQEVAPPHSSRDNTTPKPDCKPEEPKPHTLDTTAMPQSSAPLPPSTFEQAEPPKPVGAHGELSSNPHSTAASSLTGTPATSSVSSTKESLPWEESDQRQEMDPSSTGASHQIPVQQPLDAVAQPTGATAVSAANAHTSTNQQPLLAHEEVPNARAQKVITHDLAPADGGMSVEEKERKSEQERKKAILLAKLQAIDDGNTVQSPSPHPPLASKQSATKAHSPDKPNPLEPLSSETPDFGRTSVLQKRLDQELPVAGADNSSAPLEAGIPVSKGGKGEAVSDLFGTDRSAKSKDDVLPSQPQRALPTQTVAQSTFDENLSTETQLAGVTSGNPLDKPPMTSSSGSLPQWPNTVHNMYLGKPALATADDPFGTRLSGRSNKSNPRLQEKGTPLHGTESADSLAQYKPKFSRRTQQNVNRKHGDKSVNLSDDSQTQLTNMTHARRAKPTNVSDAGSGSGTISLSNVHQPWPEASSSNPQGGASHSDKGYPWEMEVKLSSVPPGQSQPKPQSNGGLNFGHVDSAKKVPGGNTPLLPHRKAKAKPLQPAIGMSSMPGAIFDDDIEELSLT